MLKRWLRELIFKIIGIDRNFYCQSEIEEERQCKYQCSHCKEYYKSLDDKRQKS